MESPHSMRGRYLEPDDPDAHVDFPPQDFRLAQWRTYHEVEPLLCPKCKGWGGHNLVLNDYQLPPNMEDTPDTRHRYCHFQSSCDQCVGWGYVSDQRDVDCIHEPDHGTPTRFNCVTNYRCLKCGKEWSVDSSD